MNVQSRFGKSPTRSLRPQPHSKMLDRLLKPNHLLFCRVLLAAIVVVTCGDGAAATSGPPIQAEAPSPTPTTIPTSTYWPAEGWRSSTPEQQGMDSELLMEMLDDIRRREANIHSVLIVRNGHLVLEAYFDPYRKDISHVVHSVTKSVTSALVGIAIDQGYIDGVDQTVLSHFPERTFSNLDPAKQAMTIEHLLTMTSGLSWPELDSSYIKPFKPGRSDVQKPGCCPVRARRSDGGRSRGKIQLQHRGFPSPICCHSRDNWD